MHFFLFALQMAQQFFACVAAGVMVGELPESTQDTMIEATRSYYQHFKSVKKS